jgi:hypothetical protein
MEHRTGPLCLRARGVLSVPSAGPRPHRRCVARYRAAHLEAVEPAVARDEHGADAPAPSIAVYWNICDIQFHVASAARPPGDSSARTASRHRSCTASGGHVGNEVDPVDADEAADVGELAAADGTCAIRSHSRSSFEYKDSMGTSSRDEQEARSDAAVPELLLRPTHHRRSGAGEPISCARGVPATRIGHLAACSATVTPAP